MWGKLKKKSYISKILTFGARISGVNKEENCVDNVHYKQSESSHGERQESCVEATGPFTLRNVDHGEERPDDVKGKPQLNLAEIKIIYLMVINHHHQIILSYCRRTDVQTETIYIKDCVVFIDT